MATIGYHASHEQFPPGALLGYLKKAEAAGFDAAMCSDHWAPWSDRQGESGFAWSWLGAALEGTTLSLGTVCAPGQRYHPAVVAQAAATLAEMYPGRFWVALGSGQFVNEHVTGEGWPPKEERNARLEECVDAIRALWDGETVTHYGRVVLEEAKLWTRPERPPLVVGAAITEETARRVAGWADALITIARPRDELREVLAAFRESGGEDKPIFLQAQHAWAETEEEAHEIAWDQWRTNIIEPSLLSDVRHPTQFDAAAEHVQAEDMAGPVRVSASLERHIEWLRGDVEMGVERIFLHHVGRDQERFLEVFGERVLPSVRA